jgi:hypothetical protein
MIDAAVALATVQTKTPVRVCRSRGLFQQRQLELAKRLRAQLFLLEPVSISSDWNILMKSRYSLSAPKIDFFCVVS